MLAAVSNPNSSALVKDVYTTKQKLLPLQKNVMIQLL